MAVIDNDDLVEWMREKGILTDDVIELFTKEKDSMGVTVAVGVHAIMCHKDHSKFISIDGAEPPPGSCPFYTEELVGGSLGTEHRRWIRITEAIIDFLPVGDRTPSVVIEVARTLNTMYLWKGIDGLASSILAIIEESNTAFQGIPLLPKIEPQKP